MELLLTDLNKENVKYLRKDIDGGYLSDKYEIDRYKLEQFNDVVDNLMLGNYNEFGEYVIQDDIKEELIKCYKVIEDNYENILFVKSQATVNVFSYLNFAVKVLASEETGYKTAVLELLEPIYKAKGYIENTQATVIKKIVLPDNEIFIDEVYKNFNILVDKNDGKKEINDDFEAIIDRKIRLLYIKQHALLQEDYMMCYKKSIDELNKTEEGKEIIKQYKKEEEIVDKYIGIEDNDYKTKEELLNNVIENKVKNYNDENIELKEVIRKIKQIKKEIEQKNAKRIKIIVDNMTKKQKRYGKEQIRETEMQKVLNNVKNNVYNHER